MIRLYQNWRQGVSTTQTPLRPLGTGEGSASATFRCALAYAREPVLTTLVVATTRSADDLDVVDEFAMSERERGSHVRMLHAIRLPLPIDASNPSPIPHRLFVCLCVCVYVH